MKDDTALLLLRGWHSALMWTGLRSIGNLMRYRGKAPRPGTRFIVSPAMIMDRYHQTSNDNRRIGHWQSGQVIGGDWDLARRPFTRSLKYRACAKHFVKGAPWTETSAISNGLEKIAKFGKYDSCRTELELLARYASLDNLWSKTKMAGDLPPEASHHTNPRTGILVHIDREGALLFGNQGFHRLAIAKLAKLEHITVVLGIVHPDALETKALKQLMARHL